MFVVSVRGEGWIWSLHLLYLFTVVNTSLPISTDRRRDGYMSIKLHSMIYERLIIHPYELFQYQNCVHLTKQAPSPRMFAIR